MAPRPLLTDLSINRPWGYGLSKCYGTRNSWARACARELIGASKHVKLHYLQHDQKSESTDNRPTLSHKADVRQSTATKTVEVSSNMYRNTLGGT